MKNAETQAMNDCINSRSRLSGTLATPRILATRKAVNTKSVFGHSGQCDQVLSFSAFNSANRRLGIKSAAVRFHRLPADD